MEKTTVSAEEIISRYIAENILFSKKGYPYSLDTSLLENGIVDSVNVLELVMFIEGTFDVKVDDSEITPNNFDSVSKLAEYVRGKKGAA